jgi:hypothetical protein
MSVREVRYSPTPNLPHPLTKYEVIAPFTHIYTISPLVTTLLRSLDPESDLLLPDSHVLKHISFQLPHRAFRESLAHDPSLPSMMSPLRGQQSTDSCRMCSEGMVESLRFLHIRTMAVDCSQRCWIVDGEGVGCKSYYWPVFGM